MGAAVGVESSNVPEDIISLFKENEELQNQISADDLAFIQSQGKQMWKNHKKIISVLCSKSKNQLNRMANQQHSKVPLATQLQDMLGGSYGDFVRNLVLSKAETNIETLRAALDCIGCDENALINVICTCSPDELSTIISTYNSAAAIDLASKIERKLESNSALGLFLKHVLGGRRDADGSVSSADAYLNMEEVHSICIGDQRDDELFRLLCRLSRAQCVLINKELIQNHNTSLDTLLKKKFKGNCSRALSLWTLPKVEAVSQVLYDILHSPNEEYDQLTTVLSKYDKNYLKDIQKAYESLFKEKLMSRVEKVTVGNLKLSLVAWMGTPCFDGGNEEVIANIIINQHGSLSQAMSNEETSASVRSALLSQRDCLRKHLAETGASVEAAAVPEPAHMTLPPIANPKTANIRNSTKLSEDIEKTVGKSARQDAPTTSVSDAKHVPEAAASLEAPLEAAAARPAPLEVNTDEPPTNGNLLGSPTKIAPLSTHSKKAVSIRNLAADFDTKFNAVSQFLKDEFAIFDRDKSGYLETAEFWNAIRALKLGYTEEEIGAMASWTDWDCDGHISLSEVINELAESVINMIEGRGDELISTLTAIKERLVKENAELVRLESDSGLSVDLVGYLKDSFEAYDTDDNGGLGPDEFWRVINVVLVETVNGLKDVELEEMRRKWDSDQDGWITWKEALEHFVTILKGMISDKRDHWIGLVDKPTGNLFWYNLRDQSSCWMSEEDQVAYRAGEKIKKTSLKYN